MSKLRRIVKRLPRAQALLLVVAPVSAADAASVDPPPRVIARFDVALLGAPNVSAQGGGGVTIPVGGTGAGLSDGYGAELGAELRLHRWIAVDASAGEYRSSLEVGRDRGPDTMADFRSENATLRTLQFGVILTPPQWRFSFGRVAIGALVMRVSVDDPPPDLEITVEDSDTGLGVDFRADFFLSAKRHWGIGAALSFVNLGPRFIDRETGTERSLQVSGFFLRFGVRGAW